MKTALMFMLLASATVFPSLAAAGGPDAEIEAHVNGVQVGEDFITFMVNGGGEIADFRTLGKVLAIVVTEDSPERCIRNRYRKNCRSN